MQNFKQIGSLGEAVALSTEIFTNFMNFHAEISVDKATASPNEPICLKFCTVTGNMI